jgi:hypothetical protein
MDAMAQKAVFLMGVAVWVADRRIAVQRTLCMCRVFTVRVDQWG